MRNAAALVRAGAQAVKLEGGRKRLPMVEAIVDAEIPVMGHIGLTPQSVHAMGGFKVQGKQLDAALALVDDAKALADAGCFAIVLEGVPDAVARMVTEAVACPPSASAPAADATARCWCSTTCSASRTACRPSSCAATRRSRPDGGRRAGGLRRRRARRRVPVRRRELPPVRRRRRALGLYGS